MLSIHKDLVLFTFDRDCLTGTNQSKKWEISKTILERCISGLAQETAVQKGFKGGYGPQIILVFPALYEGDESWSVEASWAWRSERLQPGHLPQAYLRGGPSARFTLQQDVDEVPRRLAHAVEIVLWEAVVEAANVQTGLLDAFVQKWGRPAEHHVRQHTQTPQVRR